MFDRCENNCRKFVFDIFGELAGERDGTAGNVAAFGLAKIAVLDALEDLGLGTQDRF